MKTLINCKLRPKIKIIPKFYVFLSSLIYSPSPYGTLRIIVGATSHQPVGVCKLEKTEKHILVAFLQIAAATMVSSHQPVGVCKLRKTEKHISIAFLQIAAAPCLRKWIWHRGCNREKENWRMHFR
ncbi:hypothetical protein O6H91_Y027200 [Diphasiastrum complanatum]|nr:hypothetical protein O6H91_Y027200 [Diphasiastrum complanatum]